MNQNKASVFVKVLFFGAIFIAVMGYGGMWLWNNLASPIFSLPQLTFWQTLGLMLLVRMFTGNFGPRGGFRGGRPNFKKGGFMRDRWMGMSEEERKAFKEDECKEE